MIVTMDRISENIENKQNELKKCKNERIMVIDDEELCISAMR